jgi:signal transduction histidine kinase
MARLRLVFALLGAAILVATGLLAHRALRAEEVERAARHQTLAERIFDEMERGLSDFLRREEERPIGHYAFSFEPEGAVGPGVRVRSPLSRLVPDPEAPFVVGWFQVDPDGSVHSPLVPRPEEPASGPPPDGVALAQAAKVESIVEASLAQPASPREEKTAALGATLDEAAAPAPAPAAEPALPREAPSAYDYLQSLNRAGKDRREVRLRKTERWTEAERDLADSSREAQAAGEGSLAAGRPAAPAPVRQRTAEIDPFVGRLVGEHLLLLRTVWVGGRVYRQGLVLEVDALGRWLEQRALGSLTLPGVRLAFSPGSQLEAGRLGSAPYTFSHRFADPFDPLSAELALAPLPDGPGERAVLGLAGLLVVAAGVGLVAVYRMVALRLAFAQRRSNFAAAVSHELKTPLTAIRMYVEMLRDGLVGSEEKRSEYYATLGTESERLSRLIDNVLEFSRLERGTRRLELHAAPLGPAVEEVLALLRPHAEREGFALELELEPDLPPVRFERDALAQILFNLVENALKYASRAPDRRVRVLCGAEGGRVALSVRDHGPGVAERRLGRLFEPFYRGEDELTRETRGSGIGLALVRGLAERMGAAVSARNAAGGGFEVTLLFPAA